MDSFKHSQPGIKKLMLICPFILMISCSLFGFVHAQGGIDSYLGTNRVFNFSPWIGLRLGISADASLILKYANQNIRFDYTNQDLVKERRKADVSNFSLIFYSQRESREVYSVVSYLSGTDGYKGLSLNAGVEHRITGWMKLETALYILKEGSILWYPDEEKRELFLFSLKTGLKLKIFKWLSFNPNVYLSRNSEEVNAYSFSAGFIVTPKYPFYISVYYFRYNESARYRFSGDYFSIGLNYYY